ncbi:hypothetical protein [Nocardia salmonicida]|uniref:hypothetical protein n=1 Tax=Nocardia salmonicida TaxID=53431 RepID=UPI0033F1A10D
MGVGLRAVARQEQGLELSDLEKLLLAALGKLLPAEEISEAGRLFAEAQQQGSAAGFSSVTQLPLTSPYSTADLTAELPALGQQVLTQPNCSVVEIGDLADGDRIDSPEFVDAIRGYDSVLTVVRGDRSLARSLPETTLTLRMSKFYCQERTGDSVAGKSDEIYWMTGGGSDLGAETTYASQEFGGVDSGEEFWFPGDANLLKGRVGEIVTVDIECWEKDTGSFWEEIRDALRDVANACADACSKIAEHGESSDAGLAALVAVIAGLMGAILSWLLGKDDLIQQRTIAFDRAALEQLRGNTKWLDFRGQDAWYQLVVTASGSRKITDGWPGLKQPGKEHFADNIDGATVHPDSPTKILLFKDGHWGNYDNSSQTLVEGPNGLAYIFHGLNGTPFYEGNFDAAVEDPQGSGLIYLFKGGQWCTYDLAAKKMTQGPNGLAYIFHGLNGSPFYEGNFDAAAKVPNSNTSIYLFKGGQWCTYDLAQKKMVQGPNGLAYIFHGLDGTPFYEGNFDAALSEPTSKTDIYLFKGDQYVRYDTSAKAIM